MKCCGKAQKASVFFAATRLERSIRSSGASAASGDVLGDHGPVALAVARGDGAGEALAGEARAGDVDAGLGGEREGVFQVLQRMAGRERLLRIALAAT